MYTFAEKAQATQQNVPARSTIPARGHLGHNHEVNSAFQLQRTTKNQTEQRLSDTGTEDVKGNPITPGNPRLGFDFSGIQLHTSGPRRNVQTSQTGSGGRNGHRKGSDAVNAEEERGGPIGGGETAASKSPETSSATPVTAAPAPAAPGLAAPAPTAPGPTSPTGPTITSATVKAAPSGAASTRTRVGVGEVVNFSGSVSGTWTGSIGTATGANSTTFRWTAPATTSTTTATITLTAGTRSATKTISVVPPNSISMRNAGSHTSLVGAGGACMLTAVTFGPSDVCLGAIQTLEVPGPASGISGFFTKYSAAELYHHPNSHYALVNDSNMKHAGPHNGRYDHCAWHSTVGPYSNGAFRWVIPNRYILDGESASSGRHFTNTIQRFTMNAAGTMTITKAGAST